ncbi:hypothetical protein NHX12_034051, partial [Muraenolepis orangiensis]
MFPMEMLVYLWCRVLLFQTPIHTHGSLSRSHVHRIEGSSSPQEAPVCPQEDVLGDGEECVGVLREAALPPGKPLYLQ